MPNHFSNDQRRTELEEAQVAAIGARSGERLAPCRRHPLRERTRWMDLWPPPLDDPQRGSKVAAGRPRRRCRIVVIGFTICVRGRLSEGLSAGELRRRALLFLADDG